jgi:hypothetical protein
MARATSGPSTHLEWTFRRVRGVTVGDGKTVTRQTIRTTDLPEQQQGFTIVMTGKAWVLRL